MARHERLTLVRQHFAMYLAPSSQVATTCNGGDSPDAEGDATDIVGFVIAPATPVGVDKPITEQLRQRVTVGEEQCVVAVLLECPIASSTDIVLTALLRCLDAS